MKQLLNPKLLIPLLAVVIGVVMGLSGEFKEVVEGVCKTLGVQVEQ